MHKKTKRHHLSKVAKLWLLSLFLTACGAAFEYEKEQFESWTQNLISEETSAEAFIDENQQQVTIHFSHPVKLERPSSLSLYDEENELTIRSSSVVQQRNDKIVMKFGMKIPKGNYIVKWDKTAFSRVKAGESSILQSQNPDTDMETKITLVSMKDHNLLEVDIGKYQLVGSSSEQIVVIDENHDVVANTLRVEIKGDDSIVLYLSRMLVEGKYHIVFSEGSLTDENGKTLDEQIISGAINVHVLLASAGLDTQPYGEQPEIPISSGTNNEEQVLLIGTGANTQVL